MLRKTLNSEMMKNSSGRVRVAKKKFGSGRVAGTRQTLVIMVIVMVLMICTAHPPSLLKRFVAVVLVLVRMMIGDNQALTSRAF